MVGFTNLKRNVGRVGSFRRGSKHRRPQESVLAAQESFDLNNPREMVEVSEEEVEKDLKKFRNEGGRYEYSEDNRNHFEIKRWYIVTGSLSRYFLCVC